MARNRGYYSIYYGRLAWVSIVNRELPWLATPYVGAYSRFTVAGEPNAVMSCLGYSRPFRWLIIGSLQLALRAVASNELTRSRGMLEQKCLIGEGIDSHSTC